MKKVILSNYMLITLFFLLTMQSFGQHPQWSYLASGLHVRKLAQEGNYLWAATESGLVQYDKSTGQKTVFDKSNSGLKSNLINYVFVDAAGSKWVGTRESGLYKFSAGTWQNFNTSNSPLQVDNIQCIIPDTSGALWIGTYGGGIAKLAGSQWTIYDSLNTGKQIQYVYSLAYDNYGYLWVGTAGEGIFRFDGLNEWVPYNTDNNNVLKSNVIKAIEVDTEGNKWFGTESGDGGGLYKWDGSMFTLFSTGGFSLNVYAIDFDSNNNLWVGTYGGGIAMLQGTSWTVYNTSNSGLTDNAIKCFFFDAAGVKWIGTEHKGLVKYSANTFQAINLGILPNTYVFSMAKQKDGTKWIGTKNFLTRYSNGTVESIDLTDFLINPSPGLPPTFNVWSIAFDVQGYKWIGTYDGGLVRFSPLNIPKVFNTGNSSIPSDDVYSVVVDNQDIKWIGTSNGLVKYDGTLWKIYNSSNSPLPNNYISSIVIDKQNKMWIGTTNGLARFDGVNWSVYTTANSGLPGNYTFSVAVDSLNNKWIGTGNGLAKFNGSTWTVYNTSNSGLPQNVVQFVQCDSISNIWIGSGGYVLGGGITKFNGTTWETFNTANSGMPGNQVSSLFIDESGKKWIGTFDNGVAIYNDAPVPTGSITVLTPASAAIITAGSIYQISWISNNVTAIKIEFSPDNGTTWQTVTNAVNASSGTYNWQVPTAITQQGLLRLSDSGNPALFAVSSPFRIVSNYCKDVSVVSGWNLVSNPLHATNNFYQALFPTASSIAYAYANGYVSSDSLTPGKGYWLRFPAAAVSSICGTQHVGSTVALQAGWNLLSGFDQNVLLTDVTTIPANIINSPFYQYQGSYAVAQSLEVGKGYWVRTNQSGVLHLSAKTSTSLTLPKQLDGSQVTTITCTDAAGNASEVYLSSKSFTDDAYCLPPLPPSGVFDIRFDNNSRIIADNQFGRLQLQGVVYPLQLRVKNGSISVKSFSESELPEKYLTDGESLTIPAQLSGGLLIASTTEHIRFDLGQNYPNPFNPSTQISYSLPEKSHVRLTIYDIVGNTVSELVNREQSPGNYTINFNASQLSSGVYFYRLQTSKNSAVKKMTILK